MIKRLFAASFLFLCLLWVWGCSEDSIVTDGGVHLAPAQAGRWTVPGDYSTIQEAIDSPDVVDGDTIRVGPGTFVGATVTKAVVIQGIGNAVINDGPNSHSFLRAGFLFPGGGDGSGSTIKGFTFQCESQSVRVDDGQLDFPIFSRGAQDVTVENNEMAGSLQAISNWEGSGWKVSHNKINGLYVLCGGGIGILIGSRYGTPANDNLIEYNEITANISPDCGFYTTVGIALCSDGRYGCPGGPVKNNQILYNKAVVTGWWGEESAGVGIELSQLGDGDITVVDNKVGYNDCRGSTIEINLYPETLDNYNIISRNLGQSRGQGVHPGAFRPIE